MAKTEVHIFGQTYVVKSAESPEYIQQLALFVDGKMKEVYSNFPNITPLKGAILAALEIADELHKTKNEYASMTQNIKHIEEKTDSIVRLFE
ncbi:MAG: cell division protein ZapA [Dissulfurispiraceae bacterium]